MKVGFIVGGSGKWDAYVSFSGRRVHVGSGHVPRDVDEAQAVRERQLRRQVEGRTVQASHRLGGGHIEIADLPWVVDEFVLWLTQVREQVKQRAREEVAATRERSLAIARGILGEGGVKCPSCGGDLDGDPTPTSTVDVELRCPHATMLAVGVVVGRTSSYVGARDIKVFACRRKA